MKNLFSILFCNILLFSFLTGCQEPPTPLPNIVLIMVDDLGSADVGCYGSTEIQTPNIDQLAKEGLLFTQAYSGNTVCAPARSTLMTGQHMGRTLVRGNTGGIALPDSVYTMAEMFKAAGYATGGFGKWGIGEIGTSGVPEQQGFDQFLGYYHQIHAHDYYPEYLWKNSKKVSMPGNENETDSYTAYKIFEATQQFISENQNNPFFCYAAWTVPHGKYVIPDSDPAVQLYAQKDWAPKRKNYAAMITMLDRHVGAIVQQLKELNLEENTLLIFCSDNGGDREFATYKPNGKLRGFKRDLYEGGIRIPLIARWPGRIAPGQQLKKPVYFPDFFPTFAEAIQQKGLVPKSVNGKSFYPWLLQPNKEITDRYLYWEYPHYDWGKKEYPKSQFKQALRYGDWKMVRNGEGQEWEIYNLLLDPKEMDNVAPYHPNKMDIFQKWIKKNRVDPPAQIEPERIDGKPYR